MSECMAERVRGGMRTSPGHGWPGVQPGEAALPPLGVWSLCAGNALLTSFELKMKTTAWEPLAAVETAQPVGNRHAAECGHDPQCPRGPQERRGRDSDVAPHVPGLRRLMGRLTWPAHAVDRHAALEMTFQHACDRMGREDTAPGWRPPPAGVRAQSQQLGRARPRGRGRAVGM